MKSVLAVVCVTVAFVVSFGAAVVVALAVVAAGLAFNSIQFIVIYTQFKLFYIHFVYFYDENFFGMLELYLPI